ncbi:double-strand-break repair protein rad21-like protein 1 isoform X1 [Astyanax mexicanus]|uniref:double-strand-break repair protein rad21-like protein 1 isoform X1 n=1 Tax=Astyanax mexicanus TaxID=7994 RepID=UPI0020CADD36|nr:double-strand-break repair protein rad21-like protein 1 isoform X1 [Astyanax mexicanus]XP_049342141.1 double-strand-break repair protein rad21-like protein 1 isoform X1 [Astyanax mexicanus]
MEFFTHLFTSKRGSLARIWLAAHWEKKITKAHVFECNLENTVYDIISPQVTIGLRTSGHLLLGVVRIYYRKAKYLLADCNDAVVKIKVAFRPGQTDLPNEGMEAMFKAITLPEEFSDFDLQLPDLNTIDVVDHFSLNQCRTEEITLKENFGNSFLSMDDMGDDAQSHQGLFDMSLNTLGTTGDGFGDEGMAFDLVDFIMNANENSLLNDSEDNLSNELPATPPPTAINSTVQEPAVLIPLTETPTMNETTLLDNTNEGFALEPVAATPTSERKRGSRKRKLVVDQSKELSNEAIRAQLANTSDILTSLDIAPPTRQLMDWKEKGGVDYLFSHFCVPVIHTGLQKLILRDVFPGRRGATGKAEEEQNPEEMREQGREADTENNILLTVEELSLLQETMDPDRVPEAGSFIEPSITHLEPPQSWNNASDESRLEVSYPEPLSDESMLAHPYGVSRETPQTQVQTQQSASDTQDREEKRMTSRAKNLLQALRNQDSSPEAVFSFHALAEGSNRSRAAAILFCLLVLKKQQALELHQRAPYSDIIATPGPLFHKL